MEVLQYHLFMHVALQTISFRYISHLGEEYLAASLLQPPVDLQPVSILEATMKSRRPLFGKDS